MGGLQKIAIIAIGVHISGCAMQMPADQFYSEFPMATESTYLTGAMAGKALLSGNCVVLDSHSYKAPVAMTAGGDVKNGALGVDTIVRNDGGNAYRISNHAWNLLSNGSSQLQVDFDTLLCSLEDVNENQTDSPDRVST